MRNSYYIDISQTSDRVSNKAFKLNNLINIQTKQNKI